MNVSLGEILDRLLVERGWSASDLAARIWGRYVSCEGKYVARGRDRISVWRSGKNFPIQKNLVKLADALGVGIEELTPNRVAPVDLKRASFFVSCPQCRKNLALISWPTESG